MTADQYVAGFIGMAVGIALVLALGTLAMAGILHRPGHHAKTTVAPPSTTGVAEHHHWYDRFHFHHAA